MNLAPVIRQRFLDHATGAPLAGGQLFSYQAGTSTPQATYSDQSGGTPNANPVILDSNGEANVWLDPTLSYKFILQDASNNVQWTVDNVVGILTANAVSTASIQNGAVTSAKLAAGAVNAAALQSDASIDANRPVNTNNIRDGAITHAKLSASTALIPPSLQTFTSGPGTYNPTYIFFVSGANATAGATYTNNGQTFTVKKTISSGSLLQCTSPGAPQASGTLTKASGTGDATIAYTSYINPLWIRVRLVGGGGGGGGSGDAASTQGGLGGSGGQTTFGTSLLTANGGSCGNGGTTGAAGTGGTATIGSGADGNAYQGAWGNSGTNSATNGIRPLGGSGGASPLGGAGGVVQNSAGNNAIANTGSGGAGGSLAAGDANGAWTGGGGASGGYIEAIITSASTAWAAAISYTLGTGGTGGTAGTNGFAGGNGAAGIIIVEEFYQ